MTIRDKCYYTITLTVSRGIIKFNNYTVACFKGGLGTGEPVMVCDDVSAPKPGCLPPPAPKAGGSLKDQKYYQVNLTSKQLSGIVRSRWKLI